MKPEFCLPTASETSILSEQQASVLSQQHIVVKQAKGPTHVIAQDFGNRTVTFQTDHTPQDRIAVRF